MRLVRFEEEAPHLGQTSCLETEINVGDKQTSVFVATDISAVAATLPKVEKLG
jgi:hypothetical protein